MGIGGYTLAVRDQATLGLLGEVDDYSQLEAVSRYNGVGQWQLHLDGASAAAALLLGYDRGLVLLRNGSPVYSGPVGGYERSQDRSRHTLVVRGPCDNTYLARALAWPEAPALTTATSEYDVRTGLASAVLYGYVDANCGPGAHSTRRVPGLALATDPGLGSTITGRARWDKLHELLASLALASDPALGWQVLWEPGGVLRCTVYEPVDLATEFAFGFDFGNLLAYSYSVGEPEATYAVVGGAGDGIARTYAMAGDSSAMVERGRYEGFTDSSGTSDAGELEQARLGYLAGAAAASALSITPVDTAAVVYGETYQLGDRVRVVTADGTIDDLVREVRLVLDAGGVQVVPTVASPDQRDARVPRLFDRVRHLERLTRATPGVHR